MAAIVVIDIGKTNAKLSVVDEQSGGVIATRSRKTGAIDAPPYPQLDTDTLWTWCLAELKRAQQLAPLSHICVTTHGAAAALVDDQNLVLPVLDYEHDGPDEIAARYDHQCDPFTETYSPKLPLGLNIGRQLYWQRDRFPEQFAKAKHLLSYPQYWTWRLTGNPSSEITSIGAHSDLWRPVAQDFSDFAKREKFAALIPPMMRADAVLGTVSPSVCAKTGITDTCRVLVGIHDSNASLVPYLKTKEGAFTVISTGTWVITFAVGAPLQGLVADLDCIANVNLHGEPVACARYMGGREFSAITGDEIVPASSEHLEHIISEDIFALPGFSEGGGPFATLKGHIATKRTLNAQERYALASIYCAMVTDISATAAGSMGDIIVEGAYAKNPLLLQVLNVLRQGQDVFLSTDTTGTTMGTAMLAIKNIAPPSLERVADASTTLAGKILDYRDRWKKHVAEHVAKATEANR